MGEASVFAETSMNTICHTEFIEVSHDERDLHASTNFRLHFNSIFTAFPSSLRFAGTRMGVILSFECLMVNEC
jgi:hypothetical protein